MMELTFGFGSLEAEFWRWLFLMTRIGAAFFAAPFFGSASVPVQVRVIMTGAVALLVCGWTQAAPPASVLSLAGGLAVAGEVLVGLAMGFVLQLSFAAPVIAAEIIGAGMGMSIATSVDPNSGTQSPALGQYYGIILTLVFMGMGGHLLFIDMLLKSYATFPPGHSWLGPARFAMIAGYASDMLIAAVALALPVTLVLLLVQLAMGLLSRTAPALNLFAIGLPAGVCAGGAALFLSAPLVSDRMGDLVTTALTQVESVTDGR